MGVKNLPTQELIEEYKQLHESIYVIGCYNSKDVIRFYRIETELLKRGCIIQDRVDVFPEGA